MATSEDSKVTNSSSSSDPSITIGLVVGSSRSGRYAVKNAAKKFVVSCGTRLMLIHVRQKGTPVLIRMGSDVPIRQLRDDISCAYEKEVECRPLLLIYKNICYQKMISGLHSDDKSSGSGKLKSLQSIIVNKLVGFVAFISSQIPNLKILSEKLAFGVSDSALTLLEPDILSSQEFVITISMEELIIVNLWMDLGGSFCVYHVLAGLFQSVDEVEYAINCNVDELQHQMRWTADFEFSWIETLLHGHPIMPSHVRDQGSRPACVFNALTAAGEIEKKKLAALNKPSQGCNILFLTDSLIEDYEFIAGPLGSKGEKYRTRRRPEALCLFKKQGVLASEDGAPPTRLKIDSFKWKPKLKFEQMCNIIDSGKPIVGSVPLDSKFGSLKPDEIYDFDSTRARRTASNDIMRHTVVFVGYGWRNKRPYLVFLNSYGSRFSSKGYGRVYVEWVRNLNTISFEG
ncbi:hypothetical protein PR202_gb18059 [Eleusine coracana subsp. coracana]|uniref:Peptidase C1A papain C-terminal domain-containing protein n=1 Tax=Eleusine coracana subsp. coracana TaxID=191504 RepID=A0AAV5F4I1_ELECO|nr:hypothetical protein PR202_gb17992 [Eleusine coracana subsp. coracana]GJN29804.1 hypothetical protein PR202_gb18059 [Eleusine coracana subsp. coracana]